MTTHDKYDKKLLKGIEKIADRIDKIERKMLRMVDQTENINLSTLCELAKENNCSMIVHMYPDNQVFLGVNISPTKYDHRIVGSDYSAEDMMDTFKDIIRTAKERS
jgi:hypothetical protein